MVVDSTCSSTLDTDQDLFETSAGHDAYIIVIKFIHENHTENSWSMFPNSTIC